ncbi:MAG TPA: DNA recombination protein RmuC [Acidimicrobiia bacterium]|jgi:DNA recombination protein RmuC|nr:DNA recombination protein RmuC [Acidimicrobiia bacterium]HEV3450476.1 DNA recombination protein RmuC [Acidimicrobiia bacterium]
MELVVIAVAILGPLVVAGVAGLVLRRHQLSSARLVADHERAMAGQRDAVVQAAVEQFLAHNRAALLAERELADRDLEGKKSLIDQQLAAMAAKLDDVSHLVQDVEAQRARSFGELSAQLSQQHDGLADLLHTTQSLREALSSTKARGQWGERMAEDVLRLAGFVENINYRKQRAVESGSGIPDYTFFLPNDLRLYMDVKFPLDNYLRYCEAGSDLERKRHRDDFLRDVRARVRELSGRDYVDAGGGTVDFVLLFIPNEQLYAFIHEQDDTILDEAVRQGVVFCSPLTLFVVLALIRQMVENFRLARTSDEILGLLGQFLDQWGKFKVQMEKVGQKIEAAGREYTALAGTRANTLERPLRAIEELRTRDLELVEEPDDGDPPLALEA